MLIPDAVPQSTVVIRAAEPRDLQRVIEIEQAAFGLFASSDIPVQIEDDPFTLEEVAALQSRGDLLVATDAADRAVGFAAMSTVDGHAHLMELDVDPAYGRRGIGRQLVEFVAERARAAGHSELTLTTFREVPWNRPFYASAGFVEIPVVGEELEAIVAHEEADGLEWSERCAMKREL